MISPQAGWVLLCAITTHVYGVLPDPPQSPESYWAQQLWGGLSWVLWGMEVLKIPGILHAFFMPLSFKEMELGTQSHQLSHSQWVTPD